MKSIVNILIVSCMALSTITSNAQIKNGTSITVKILGNCDSSKAAIENTGSLKNTAQVTWNKDSNMAEILFDSQKTNPDEILKRIALAGFDSEFFLAPDMAYARLDTKCKYDRENKKLAAIAELEDAESNPSHARHGMVMDSADVQEMSTTAMPVENPLVPVFANYLALKDALVKSSATTAASRSLELVTSFESLNTGSMKADAQALVNKLKPSLMDAAKGISTIKDINKQRTLFKGLSSAMHEILPLYSASETLYYQYCPMQDASWISLDKAVKNPYYGSQMLSCGSTVETVEPKK